MKKYIRGSICLGYSYIKFNLIKLFHFSGFKFTVFNLFSPFTEIDLGKKSNLEINKMVRARSGVKLKVRDKAELIIGEGSSFNHGCIVVSHLKIIIGKNVQFGPNVFIYDHDHDFRKEDGLKNLKYKTKPVIIGDNVWIGANCVILRGSIVGNNSVIGAGTVVKGVFPDNSIILNDRDIKVKPY